MTSLITGSAATAFDSEPADPSPLRTGSLRRRVVVAVLALLAALLLVLSITVDQVLHKRLEGQIEQRLTDRATIASALADKVDAQDLVRRLSGDGVSVQFRTSDGSTYTGRPADQRGPDPRQGVRPPLSCPRTGEGTCGGSGTDR